MGNTSGSTTTSPSGDEECSGAELTSTLRYVFLLYKVPCVLATGEALSSLRFRW